MPEARLALGVDVGGTKVALVVLDADGAVVDERRLVNREYPDATALLEAVAGAAAALADGRSLEGVGVGICELVGVTGEIESSTTIPWTRADLSRALSAIGPLTLDADVRAAARAEAQFGAGRPFDSFGYVTVGTGVSSTFVRDGEPWLGAHRAAQLLGTARLTLPCPHCGRMIDVSLEDVASGAGIVRRYRERSGVDLAGGDEVIEAARGGDADAEGVLSEAADTLGSFIAFFLNLLDPDAMVIGGGVVSAASPFRERVLTGGGSRIWAPSARATPILLGELGPNVGAIGAAWSVLAGARTG